ncbi:MAG: NYN domain-containing protein, partial [Burkholderiaceae bacterium]
MNPQRNLHQPRVMLLIDADNVSADVIDQAVAMILSEHGAIHVRRAYCTAESALANLRLFTTHSIRPIVNLSTGKNSTDIALAVDAMDLVVAERPDVAIILSSDSDFAPLVIRLREKGCRVEGIGQLGKTGDDSKPVYDHFFDIAHRRGGRVAETAPAKRATRSRARAAAAAPEVEDGLIEVREPRPTREPRASSPRRGAAEPRPSRAADAA